MFRASASTQSLSDNLRLEGLNFYDRLSILLSQRLGVLHTQEVMLK